jgi:thiol-disulfide isomerase/thioredoxin
VGNFSGSNRARLRVRLPSLVVVLFLAVAGVAGPRIGQSDGKRSGEEERLRGLGAEAFNAGRISEARAIFKDVLSRFPDAYDVYSLYWNSVGRTDDPAVLRAVVRADVQRIERVPVDSRSEEFYGAVIYGYSEILDDKGRAEAFRREAIERFPRGSIAQSAMLDAARAERDPTRSVAKFQAYIDTFPENTSWTESAANSAFFVAARHRDRFDSATFLKLSAQRERLSMRFVETFGNEYRYVAALSQIASELSETNPVESLRYATLGVAFVDERWMSSDEFSDDARWYFYPSLLKAQNALCAWSEARKVGEAVVRELDDGRSLIVGALAADESVLRRDYARALEGAGDVPNARLQISWAAAMNPSLAGERDAFNGRHPVDDSAGRQFNERLRTGMEEVAARKEGRQRSQLLATAQRRPATNFTLVDLGGRSVSLEGLRGKVVVFTVWASWCAPCIAELEQWKLVVRQYKADSDVVLLAVNVDTDKAAARECAEKRQYDFPILLSDGSIERSYPTASIPQLFVVDREGYVRFNVSGYVDDGAYVKRLGWMISAAR